MLEEKDVHEEDVLKEDMVKDNLLADGNVLLCLEAAQDFLVQSNNVKNLAGMPHVCLGEYCMGSS